MMTTTITYKMHRMSMDRKKIQPLSIFINSGWNKLQFVHLLVSSFYWLSECTQSALKEKEIFWKKKLQIDKKGHLKKNEW